METAWEIIDELDREDMESWDASFMDWLKGMLRSEILAMDPQVRHWMNKRQYVERRRWYRSTSSYKG